MYVGSVALLSNNPTIVSGISRSESSNGVVVTVTISPGVRLEIPIKSMSPATSSNSPPSMVTGPVFTNWRGAVAMESFEGSTSVRVAPAGTASINNHSRIAPFRFCPAGRNAIDRLAITICSSP